MHSTHISPVYYPLDYIWGIDLDIIIKFNMAEYRVPKNKILDKRSEAYTPRPTIPGQIIKILQENGIEADTTEYFSDNGEGDSAKTWAIEAGPFSALLDYEEEDFKSNEWSVCVVKIISPVLPYTYESFFQLDIVLRTIRENFHVRVSPSCGMNAHIGTVYPDDDHPLESKGFPLQTVRNLLQLINTFEPQLNNIHPPCRVSGPTGRFPKGSLLRPLDKWAATTAIESCEGILDLFHLWECTFLVDKKSKKGNPWCQISNLLSRAEYNCPENPTRTILFRQHRSSVDFETVYHWIKLIVRMAKFAHECGPGGLPLSLLLKADKERRMQTGEFGTLAFLNAIGAKTCAKFYRKRLYAHDPPQHLQPDNNYDSDEDSRDEEVIYRDHNYVDLPGPSDFIPSSPPHEPVTFTPAESLSRSSSIYHDFPEAYNERENSLPSNMNSSTAQTWTPPESIIPGEEDPPQPFFECDSGIGSYGLSSASGLSEWSHITDVLTPDGGRQRARCDSSCRDKIFRCPPDFVIEDGRGPKTRGDGDMTWDLTHRRVQY